MPLFFFVSGYLIFGKKKNNILETIKKSFFKYIIPYYAFFFISIFFTEIVLSLLNRGAILQYQINIQKFFLALFLGGGYLTEIPCSNFSLWYLPLYFIARNCFELITYKKIEKFLPIIIILLIIITIPFQKLFPGRPFLHINVLPAALVFMGLGYLFKKYEGKDKDNVVFSIIALIIGIIISYINGGNISEINNIIYFIGAICSIYFWYHMAKQSKNKILEYIGKNSFIIYSVHELILATYYFTNIDKILLINWKPDIMFLIIRLLYITIISMLINYIYMWMKKIQINPFQKKDKRKL